MRAGYAKYSSDETSEDDSLGDDEDFDPNDPEKHADAANGLSFQFVEATCRKRCRNKRLREKLGSENEHEPHSTEGVTISSSDTKLQRTSRSQPDSKCKRSPPPLASGKGGAKEVN
jgi:hypothetical protein